MNFRSYRIRFCELLDTWNEMEFSRTHLEEAMDLVVVLAF